MIGGLDAEALFVNEHFLALEDFKCWQDLYRDAAARGDPILIGAA
jgi:hypothetical protein